MIQPVIPTDPRTSSEQVSLIFLIWFWFGQVVLCHVSNLSWPIAVHPVNQKTNKKNTFDQRHFIRFYIMTVTLSFDLTFVCLGSSDFYPELDTTSRDILVYTGDNVLS